MISFLETENFKKLGTYRTELTDGTNLILGENGIGKTTFFNAVRFALYGTAAIAASTENIPTWGYKNCKVTLGYTGQFLIERTLKDCKIYRAEDSGMLTKSPELKVAEGNKACTEWIKEHLGLDHKMFSIFNMSMQGETGALITLGATELNRIVENFSGIGILDKVIKSLSKSHSHLEGALGTVEYVDVKELTAKVAELSTELGKMDAAVKFEEETLQELRDRKSVTDKAYNDAMNHNAYVRTQLTELERVKERIASTTPRVNELIEQIKKFSGILESYDIEQLESSFQEIDDKILRFNKDSGLHSNYESQLSKLTTDKSTYEQNSKKESEVATQKSNLELLIDKKSTSVAELGENLSNLTHEAAHSKTTLEGGTCHACDRPFEDFDPEMAQLNYDQAKSKAETANTLYNEAKAELKRLQDEYRNLPNYGSGNAEAAAKCQLEIDKLRGELQVLEERWTGFDDEIAHSDKRRLMDDLQTARQARSQIHSDKKSLAPAKELLEEAQSMLSQYDTIPEPLATIQLQAESGQLAEECTKQEQDLYRMVNSRNEAKSVHTVRASELKRVEASNIEYLKYGEDIDRVKRLMKHLRDSRAQYMDGVWSLILGVASEWINKTTSGWITAVGRNQKGEFTFTEEGVIAPVHSEASGAQKEFIGVSLRIGLGMSLQGDQTMLLLDEPTAGMREDNADKLATGLLGVAGQKIIITHRQSERLTAANVITL